MHKPFSSIEFGFASAETESAEAPHLLLEAFLDTQDLVRQATRGSAFLFLGPKGSGKSAIGLHISLVAKNNPHLFVTHRALGDLSFQSLEQIGQEEVESELRYLRAWTWLLLLDLLGSVVTDQGVTAADGRRFEKTVTTLKRLGLLPVGDLSEMVGRSSSRTFSVAGWGLEFSSDSESENSRLPLSAAINTLKDILTSVSTTSRHVLIIDGLDDVLLDADFQLEALSALVLAAFRLNQLFREKQAPLKILILCRTDIYERLPGSNQNKIRQDLALELNWFQESGDPASTNLVKLVNLRAALSEPSLQDVFSTYFPSRIKGRSSIMFVLEHTRHTPRDLIQALRYIQQAHRGGAELSHGHVTAGLRAYAEKHFLPEIKDELDGVVHRGETEDILESLRQFHKSEFEEAEFREFLSRRQETADLELDRLLRALYIAGAIGNVYVMPNGYRRYSFRYRNPGSVYNRNETIVVQKGLRRALQLP